jgi:eukaryotic-like serine/threonine-protein kinase
VLMHQIFHLAPADLTTLREGVSPRLAGLISKALSKKREDRQVDWDEFARELAALVTRGDVPRGPLQGVVDSERFSLLRQLEFFARFGDVELWEVVHRAKWQRFKFGDALFRKGDNGNTFHIVAHGQVEVVREGKVVATLGPGQSVGEMAYLAPNEELRTHQVDVVVPQATTTVSFTPNTLGQLGPGTQLLFDKAFIAVLVRRLHAAHEALAHPRRIL